MKDKMSCKKEGMKFKFCALSLLFSILLISCNSSKEEVNPVYTEINTTETTLEIKNSISAIDEDSIIQNLQGVWKEPEYPFRLAHFRDSTVKFTEEGVVEEPRFRDYRISSKCPYEVNNLKNARSDDVFLVMVEGGTCEILKVSRDSFTLSGFNTHTSSDYTIIYKKVK